MAWRLLYLSKQEEIWLTTRLWQSWINLKASYYIQIKYFLQSSKKTAKKHLYKTIYFFYNNKKNG